MDEQIIKSKYSHSRIGIIGYFTFPFGSAGASRIRNISKGLMQEGASVNVITQARCEYDENGANSLRRFEGIPYFTTYHGSKNHPFSSVGRLLNFSHSVFESAHLLKELIISKQIDAVILYTLSFLSAFPILKVCKEFNIPIINDVVEWVTPNVFALRFLEPQYLQIIMKRKLLDHRFSGATVISSYLYDKYSQFGYPVLRIPALCDFESFQPTITEASKISRLKLAFVGGNKINDGLDDLLEALRTGDFGDFVNLKVIGDSSSNRHGMKLRAMVNNDSKLKRSVTFTGKLTDVDYLACLADSDVLLLTRRDNTMARAAFPTRLPEFLATGKVVITTSVPDVPEYLVDEEHALVVSPGRPDLLAAKINMLLKNRNLAASIGNSGRKQAMKLFDYRIHARKLLEFFNTLQ